jgi:hypothetical protein
MFGEESRLDVHTAIVARWLFGVARLAIERAAVKELLEPRALTIVQMDEIPGQSLPIATAVALANVVFVQKRCVVVVDPFGYDPRSGAKRAGHSQLSHDRFADESALVGQLVEEMSQFFFGFEGDNLRFRGTSGHKLGTILW